MSDERSEGRAEDPTATLIDAEGEPATETTETVLDGEMPPAAELLAPLRAERDRLKDQLLRTAAEYDNFRKRTKMELEEAERRGKEEAVRELLPVIDNLERAVGAATAATDVMAIVDGVRMVLKLFEDQASRIGLERVAAVGARFDPAVHDAIQQKETDEHPPGTVITEVLAGYRLGERLVRAAMVIVARKPSDPA